MISSLSNLIHLPQLLDNNAEQEEKEQAIIDLLQSRFNANQPYIQLGHHRLLLVNPYKTLELLNDATLQAYGQYGYKNISSSLDNITPEPHVYEMATRVYLLMRRRSENQAIILSGMTGSGKSITYQHLLKELLYLSTHTRKEEKINTQIMAVNTIFDSFGSASASATTTQPNNTTSCINRFHTLQFNERGRIMGCSTSIFLLEKHRSTSRHMIQFNIFYQLVAGTTMDEKQALHITHINFAYLKHQRNVDQDAMAFNEIKAALKVCGFKTKTVAQMCQLLAAILHLGNIQFIDNNKYDAAAPVMTSSESCRIKNKEIVRLVAAALGVSTSKLEATLTHQSKLIGNEFCTAFLTVETASQQRDTLAQTLYTVLVLWIMNSLNQKLSSMQGQATRTISILDTRGFHLKTTGAGSTFHDLCINYTNEQLQQYVLYRNFTPDMNPSHDGIASPQTTTLSLLLPPPFSLSLYHGTTANTNNPFALIPLLNQESKRFSNYALDATDSNLLSILFLQKKKSSSSSSSSVDYRALLNPSTPSYSFAIRHYNQINIDYSVDGFLEANLDAISPDFIHLFKYSCTNAFVQNLFDDTINTEMHPRDERTIIKAQLPAWPPMLHTPAVQQELQDATEKQQPQKRIVSAIQSVFDQVVLGVDTLKKLLDDKCISEIIHLSPNSQHKPHLFDASYISQQLQVLQVPQIVQYAIHSDILYPYTYDDFITRYKPLIDLSLSPTSSTTPDESRHRIQEWMQSTGHQIQLGHHHLWVDFDTWRQMETEIRSMEKEARSLEKARVAAMEAEKEAMRQAAMAAVLEAEEYEAAQKAQAEAEAMAQAAEIAAIAADRWSSSSSNRLGGGGNCSDFEYDDQTTTEIDTQFSYGGPAARKSGEWGEDDDDDDEKGLAKGFGPNLDMSKMMQDYSTLQPKEEEEQIQEVSITRIRHWWSSFVIFTTWWIPSFLLKHIGKMARQDVQMAWREKVTLCILIFSFSGSIIFFIVGLGQVICPGTKDLYTSQDVLNHQTMNDYWISVRGKVYDVTRFVATDHGTNVYMAGKHNMDALAGRDLSWTFPPPLSIACAGLVNDAGVTVTPNETIVLGPFVHFSGPQQTEKTLTKLRDPYWLNKYFGPTMNVYKKGDVVISMKTVKQDYEGWGRLIAAIDDRVYDLTDYMATARRNSIDAPGVPNYHYLDSTIETLFTNFGGKDATSEWLHYSASMDEPTRIRNKACLDNVFYIGRVDYRESIRCTFINYLLLSFAVIMSLVILVKFLAALQFGSAPTPEDHDKFVICQVPCYTEDEESLKKTIDSLAAMSYDDKHKLLFLIADGMIIGSGNDRPTPRILLDILGHNDQDESEALMFKSIGEGSKQLNYGKVYSGLYQHEGHVVPYIVVVKVGKASERAKPGNRGKRDSQIICMNFLNKVHFDAEMSPLELEIYYHIKNIIGIDPGLYEYILMVDSDTEVYPDALNRLISCMLHDSRIIGICGETELGNEDRSWTTMIQVYEYYISHHLVKSFESLFGSVTCLPGCFCMYRIRTANNKRQPLIVSPNVIHAYSDNQVDTLHKKNLLHLGEDRYLTTLMMKNFPQYKMMFTPYAKCRTVAPDQWRVLLSQRRRWINSTIHNLLELILLQELCGFCCLSMRFVVMIDLIGTITLPSSVIYIIYLLYEVISGSGPVPTIALGMLAGAYGLQSLIFIFKRQWQHIGWMIIYILAIPIFSFFIPLYAFWHFDDFSWGNTRVVVGDNKKKKQIIVTDDEKFDEKMIPLKKWAVYEQEMWETKTLRSEVTSSTGGDKSMAAASYSCYDDDGFSQAKSIVSCSSNHRSPRHQHHYHHHRHHHEPCQPYDTRSSRSHSSIITTDTNNNSKKNYSLLPPPLITSFSNNDAALGGKFTVDLSALFKPKTTVADDNQQLSTTTGESKIVMLPEDSEIERETHRILLNSNLMTLTKKQVRDQLSVLFNVDLTIKKGFINTTIERFLEESSD